jgi:hypothetical protein
MAAPHARNARRTRPYSADELRAMFAQGDSVAQVAARAYRLDRAMTRDRVRAILFAPVPA